MGFMERAWLKIYGVLGKTSLKRTVFNALNKKLLVVAAFPRAASRNLAGKICELNAGDIKYTGDLGLCPGIGHSFVDRHKLRIGLPIFRHALIYGHIPIIQYNYQIFKHYKNVCVMVPVRPLPDVLISYRDFMRSGHGPLDWRAPNSGPEGCPGFSQMDPVRQIDYLLDYIAPWYTRFVSSWLSARKIFNPIFISFESQIGRPVETLAAVFGHIGLKLDQAKLESLRCSTKTYNKNVGVSGRGSELNPQQTERLKALMSYDQQISETGMDRYLLDGSTEKIKQGTGEIVFI